MIINNIKRSFRIQYVSNLNVHKHCLKEIIKKMNPCASSIALLGDIGTPNSERTKNFMKWCNMTYKDVYWVPGFLELSDTEDKKHTWVERYDTCYENINKWDLKNIKLCYKSDIYTENPDIQLLLTTLWHSTNTHNLYTYSSNGPKKMDENDFKTIMNSEYEWILRRSIIPGKPVAWLTYSSCYSQANTNLKMPSFCSKYILSTLNDTRPIKFPNLLTTICGYSGEKSWFSANMGGHSGFIRNEFWEYSKEAVSLDILNKNLYP